MRGPRQAQPIRDDLVAELERAGARSRWSSTGRRSWSTSRRGPRELEAQTSIKRGYLNLIHAREAFARHALEAQEFEVEASPRTPAAAAPDGTRDHTI